MKMDLKGIIYAIIILFLVIMLTLVSSPILHSSINNAIVQSNHYGFTIDAEVLGFFLLIVDLHGLLAIIIEIIVTFSLIYKFISNKHFKL